VKKIILYFILGVMLVILGAAIYFGSYANVVKQITIPVTVEITDNNRKMGLNVDTDALHFGTMGRGSTSGRFVDINNTGEFPVTVELSGHGPMGKYIVFEESDFFLDIDDSRHLGIDLAIPIYQSLGKSTGSVKILFKRVRE
tara:strand:+ start:6139 stop:6564 length:426 start_codon:yes stop_codon:yes gene_type:complete